MTLSISRLLPVVLVLMALPTAALAELKADAPCPTVTLEKMALGDSLGIKAINTTPEIRITHYHWRTNAGKIVQGQHTSSILLYSPQQAPTITLEFKGKFPYTCSRTIEEALH